MMTPQDSLFCHHVGFFGKAALEGIHLNKAAQFHPACVGLGLL